MTSTFITELLVDPAPTTLQEWSWQAMIASFPKNEMADVWGGTLEYIGWLDSLPVKEAS